MELFGDGTVLVFQQWCRIQGGGTEFFHTACILGKLKETEALMRAYTKSGPPIIAAGDKQFVALVMSQEGRIKLDGKLPQAPESESRCAVPP